MKNVSDKVVTPSPEKIEQNNNKMTAQEDLGVTLLTGISFKQRRRLKKFLGGRDTFASTRSFEKMKKQLGSLTRYELNKNEDCIFCTNVKEAIKFLENFNMF